MNYELHNVKVKSMILQWKEIKWWIEMFNLDRSVHLGEHQASVCQGQWSELPKYHVDVFSLHSAYSGSVLTTCLESFVCCGITYPG
jgi:hypothetical protein